MKHLTHIVLASMIIAFSLTVPVYAEELSKSNYTDCAGIGVMLAQQDGAKIMSVVSGSPADLAGIKQGDRIQTIDGKDTTGLSHRDASDALRGATGTVVKIMIERRDKTISEFSLTRVDLSLLYSDFTVVPATPVPATNPAPLALPTNSQEALIQLVQELQKINARLDKLEGKNENTFDDYSFERQKSDPKLLKDIVLPENPTKDQARDYIHKILAATEGQNSFSDFDPQIGMLVLVGEDNLDLLLETADDNPSGSATIHVNYAIKRLATDKSKDLILKSLEKNKELADVVLEHHWQSDVKDILLAKLGTGYLPNEWIEAVVSFNDPATYDALIRHFENGSNKAQTYNLIRELPGISLEKSVNVAWDRSKRAHAWERNSMAMIAMDYGRQDALESLINALETKESRRNKYMLDQIHFAILDHTDIPESRINDAKAWYAEVKESLKFDPATKKFTQGVK